MAVFSLANGSTKIWVSSLKAKNLNFGFEASYSLQEAVFSLGVSKFRLSFSPCPRIFGDKNLLFLCPIFEVTICEHPFIPN